MLLSIFSDGNWLFPLLVLLALLGTGEYIAKKKNMPKIDKIINITGYVVMIGLLIIYWILYFVTPKDISLYNVLLVTILTFYIVSDKVLEHFKDRLKSKYGKLKVTISTIYILLIVALIIVGSRFFSWIAFFYGKLDYCNK